MKGKITTLVINSLDRISGTSDDAKYGANWDYLLESGEYKMTWKYIESELVPITFTLTEVGFTATDTIQLYDVTNSVIVPFPSAVRGVQYRLITLYTNNQATSIARFLQFNTPDWYGIWVNAYHSVNNPTGYPTSGNVNIGGQTYVIWPYTFTLNTGGSLNLYIYGLTNSNTTPYLPLTQYALINIIS